MDDLEAARDVRRSVRPRRAASPRRLVLAFVAALCCGPIMTGHAAAGNIPNQGGPVMATAKAFLIFWLPPNHSFASGNGGDATFETTIGNFFTDIHKSDYFDIATQYSGTCQGKPCSPQNTAAGVTLGGTWVDTGAFPETVLSDADIQAEVLRALAQNPKWKQSVGLGAEFFVFLPEGVQECDNGVCSAVDFCAYHDAFTNNGADVIYAVMPQVHSIGAGCSFNSSTATEWSPSLGGNFSPSTTPNQVEADWEIVPMSHEFFESVTDPLVSTTPAWFDPNGVSAGDTEIGDHCDLMVGGDIAANGSNVTLGAHNYLVQQIWSNGIPGCALGLTIKLTIVTGSDDLRGDSSATALLQTPAGSTLEQVTLKAQSDSGWPNNSTNERIFRYNGGQPLTLGDVDVTLTSHNSFPETDDNWNINGIDIKVLDPVGNALCDQSFNGNPVARLTGSAGTAEFDTPNCQPPVPPTATFSQIVFNIVTGGDDLRGDSSATASVNLPGGAQTFTLKAQSDGGWENNSDHVKSFAISPPQPLAAFGPITITLTSHNSFPETDDNWNIQNVDVTATGPSGQACVLNQGGNPLARLTGSGPSITLDPRAGCPYVPPASQALAPQTFQSLDAQNILVLGTDGNLWLEQAPFGKVPPARQQIDGNTRTFQGLTTQSVYVLGNDGNLWLEQAPFGKPPPARQQVDAGVDAFQALDQQTVVVLGMDRNLWLEQAPFGKVPPSRQQIDGSVLAFQVLDNQEVVVLATDGNLWLEQAPFGKVPPARQQIDANVQAVQAVNAGNIFVLATDGNLWLEQAPFGKVPPSRQQVDEEVMKVKASGVYAWAWVLETNGKLWLELAPFGKIPPANRQEVDANVQSFEQIDINHALVLGTDGKLWLEQAPFGKVPPSRQEVDANVAP